MDKNKKVIEPEIVDPKERSQRKNFDSFNNVSGFAREFADDEIRGIKNKILIQGFLYLFVIGFILILVIWGVAKILTFIVPPIFAIFVTGAIVLAIGYPVYWIIKKIRK